MLWIDPVGDRSALATLQQDIVDASESLGYKAEARPYHPHITVARKYAGDEKMALQSLLNQEHELTGVRLEC